MKLEHFPQPYPPTGGMAGQGVTNLLGSPTHDLLTTLVRESVQNSWDARLSEDPGPDAPAPEWRAHLRHATQKQREALTTALGGCSGLADSGEHSLQRQLNASRLTLLEISDWHTKGLGGPTDPQESVDSGEDSNYVDFLFNTGSPRDVHHGGGTYGYGKAAYFLMSRCRTMLVHSRAQNESGDKAERLIALRIGEDYSGTNGRRFTGRHWWGHKVDERIDPLFGNDAAQLAAKLGLPARPSGKSGTTVLLIAADLQTDQLEEQGHSILTALLWNFWPKLNTSSTRPVAHMEFQITVEDKSIEIPDITQIAPFHIFAEVHANLIDDEEEGTPIKFYSECLGHLHTRKSMKDDERYTEYIETGSTTGSNEEQNEARVVPDPCTHIALMRPAELVVKYLTGPSPLEGSEYAGVFICSEEHEHIFARSEPPAHDDWIPDSLEKKDAGRVSTALRKIKKEVKSLYETKKESSKSGTEAHLGGLSSKLGEALMLGGGHGAGIMKAGNKQATRQTRSTSSRPIGRTQPMGLEMYKGKRHARFSIEVQNAGKGEVELSALVKIACTGGTVSPESLGLVQLDTRWRVEGGDVWSGSANRWLASGTGSVELLVESPDELGLDVVVQGVQS